MMFLDSLTTTPTRYNTPGRGVLWLVNNVLARFSRFLVSDVVCSLGLSGSMRCGVGGAGRFAERKSPAVTSSGVNALVQSAENLPPVALPSASLVRTSEGQTPIAGKTTRTGEKDGLSTELVTSMFGSNRMGLSLTGWNIILFGSGRMVVRFRRATSSITSTGSRATTGSRTWLLCHGSTIMSATQSRMRRGFGNWKLNSRSFAALANSIPDVTPTDARFGGLFALS